MGVSTEYQLKTSEKYILAQLLVCGAVTESEFQMATDFRKTVREERLERLDEKQILDDTLYNQCQE